MDWTQGSIRCVLCQLFSLLLALSVSHPGGWRCGQVKVVASSLLLFSSLSNNRPSQPRSLALLRADADVHRSERSQWQERFSWITLIHDVNKNLTLYRVRGAPNVKKRSRQLIATSQPARAPPLPPARPAVACVHKCSSARTRGAELGQVCCKDGRERCIDRDRGDGQKRRIQGPKGCCAHGRAKC